MAIAARLDNSPEAAEQPKGSVRVELARTTAPDQAHPLEGTTGHGNNHGHQGETRSC